MTDELKPCPFCGGKTRIVHTSSNDLMNVPNGVIVSCETPGCTIEGPWDLGRSGAIERWNTRPIEDTQAAEIERLRADLTLTDEVLKIAVDALTEIKHGALNLHPKMAEILYRETATKALAAIERDKR